MINTNSSSMATSIHTHRWHPLGEAARQARGVYLLHGIGEHAGRYERLASRLTERGYVVAAHDHPGHGKSSGKRGILSSNDELEVVAAEQFRAFAAEIGSTPILFGHSLGALVATSMVLNHDVEVAGLILSAPAYSPIISRFNKFKLAVLNLIAPRFAQQLPYEPQKLTHDEIEQQKALADPLNHRYKSASIISWLVQTGALVIRKAGTLRVQTLVLIAGEDYVVDTQGVRRFIAKAPAQYITEHLYQDFRHEVLNETPERREQVLLDIEQWLDKRL